MGDDLLFTVPEVAEILKVNNNKVYDLFRAGVLKPLKLGRYKVSRIELIAFVKSYKGKDLTDLSNVKEISWEV